MKKIKFSYFSEGKPLALTMSYDDGQAYDLRLAEIFDKHGIRATFHLNSGTLNAPGFLADADVCALSARHEISCHSVTHPFLDRVPAETALREILADKETLEELSGGLVRGMSYPFGTYSPALITLLRAAGMEYSRTVRAANQFSIPNDFMEWHPTTHHDGDLTGLWEKFTAPARWDSARLMYVWGHSYEFPRNNNWEMIENFCGIAGNREDVWYATNIEIFDYVTALNGLRFSSGGKKVWNPSASPVWIGVDGECVKVPGGATIEI